ncbi:MAG: flagellar basal body-associated FliL family protein [Gammaproteobacteria bacterium]|nr:flagellar basal body-associated FliL family protein [Gammaproteobacteria bacterium]
MADEELELDVNEKKGGKKTIIMIVVGILLLNGIGIGAWLFLSGDDKKSSGTAEKQEVVLGPLKYLTMVPEFVVNFGPGSKVRYLQVDLQIATRQEASLATVNTYRPVLRNDILIVLSGVNYQVLKDRAGKEALQKKLLNTINKVIVAAEHPAPHGEKKDSDDNKHGNEDVKGPIENVYFTSFIMQ